MPRSVARHSAAISPAVRTRSLPCGSAGTQRHYPAIVSATQGGAGPKSGHVSAAKQEPGQRDQAGDEDGEHGGSLQPVHERPGVGARTA